MMDPACVWFRDRFRRDWRMLYDDLKEPYLPLKPKGKGGGIYAHAVGAVAVWINGSRRPHALARQFPYLKLVQHGDTEHLFHCAVLGVNVDELLAAAGAYRRKQLSDAQRAAIAERLRRSRSIVAG